MPVKSVDEIAWQLGMMALLRRLIAEIAVGQPDGLAFLRTIEQRAIADLDVMPIGADSKDGEQIVKEVAAANITHMLSGIKFAR